MVTALGMHAGQGYFLGRPSVNSESQGRSPDGMAPTDLREERRMSGGVGQFANQIVAADRDRPESLTFVVTLSGSCLFEYAVGLTADGSGGSRSGATFAQPQPG